tara:strand:+ start:83 stop:319 length:237 start_codon:yes stop_codon:yes gene_type:complete
LNKVYQVDTSRKAKDETNTMNIFSGRLETSTTSYTGNAQKAHYFSLFFKFLAGLLLFSGQIDGINLCGVFYLTKNQVL